MGQRWANNEIDLLRVMYPTTSSYEISKLLNRSPKAIRNKALRLKLHAKKRNYSFPKSIKTNWFVSPELSYLIGAIKGDGSVVRISHYHYYITLSAKDFEFVNEVSKCLTKVVNRPCKIYKIKNGKSFLFRVQVSDKNLWHLLNKPIKELTKYIEAFPRYFLRGFFDAEGTALAQVVSRVSKNSGIKWTWTQYTVRFYNTDKSLIDYVRLLLLKLGIYPCPKTYRTTGNLSEKPKICYILQISRKNSVSKFMKIVGSSIPRKRLNI